MGLRLASAAECSGVASAVRAFRDHWASFPTLWECPFAGTPEDIRALDYLRYEGLGYPDLGFAGAALVWGNVLATSGPFRWRADDSTGYLVLSPGREEPTTPIVWPYGRVFESELRGPVTFQRLTARVVAECLELSGLDREEEARLVSLVDESACSEYSRRLEAVLAEKDRS